MDRIVIIGTTGSGKSTLAAALAGRLNAACIDLDALHWGPNWQGAPTEVLRERVAQAASVERWVVAGNYSKTRDLTWTRADTLVWLDYAFPLVLWRLFRRTLARIITQEDLWGSGNRESWRGTFFSRDSLLVWAFKTHWKYQKSIALAVRQPEYAHLRVLRFRTPGETARWLKSVTLQG
jgi:adenylate kinase family enzyme